MNRGEIKEEVHLLTGRRDLDPNVNKWIDQVRKNLATELDLPFDDYYKTATTSVTNGDDSYTLPSNYLRHLMVHLDDKKLIEIDDKFWAQQYDTSITSSETTGEPKYYIRRGNILELHPPPDSSYTLTLRYYGIPDDLNNDSSTDSLLILYPQVVIWGVVKRAAVFTRDGELKRLADSEYGSVFMGMAEDVKRSMQGDRAVRFKTIKDFGVTELRRRMGLIDE